MPRLSVTGKWAFGVAALSLPALLVALVTELLAGPFDTCASPIYTPGQNIVLAAFFGSGAVLVIGVFIAAYGKASRSDVIAIVTLDLIAVAAFVVVVALYTTHATFACS